MNVLTYTAVDVHGERKKGVIKASYMSDAHRALKNMGLTHVHTEDQPDFTCVPEEEYKPSQALINRPYIIWALIVAMVIILFRDGALFNIANTELSLVLGIIGSFVLWQAGLFAWRPKKKDPKEPESDEQEPEVEPDVEAEVDE